MSSLSTSLKNSYQKYLHPYEEYVKTAKPGVQQQLEAEYGGPLTPSPAGSPAGKLGAKIALRSPGGLPESPLAHAKNVSNMFNAVIREKPVDTDNDSPMPDATPEAADARTSSAGGFTAVNNGGGFVAVNVIKTEAESTPGPNETPRPSSRGSKRQHSERSMSPSKELSGGEGDKEPGERRSKRLKKGKTEISSCHLTHANLCSSPYCGWI